MKTKNVRPLLFALSLALALTARAQTPASEPGNKTGDAKSEASKPPTSDLGNCVELDVSLVTFDMKEIEDIARKSRTAAPTQEQILQAWEAGKGRLLATSKAITPAGQQTKTEGMVEKIYPGEYEPPRVFDRHAPATQYDWMSQPTPGGFQTRNVGFTVNATPQFTDDGKSITVTLIPELTEFLGWNSIEAGAIEGNRKSTMWVPQPDFYVRRTTTTLVIPVNGTMVSGGMADSTGKLVTYVFVTARRAQPALKK